MAFERLSLEQGLSQSTVLTIFQDSRGFIWLGTEDGLDRYDGLSFTSYKYDAKDPASLPNNMVWAIAEDAQGDLWVGTEGGGIARWDHERDHFVRLGAGKGASLRIPPRVRALLVAGDGTVWIGTKDEGLARLDPKSGRVEAFRHDPDRASSLTSDGVYAILPDRAGKLWIGTDGGLDRLDPATGAITRHPSNSAAGRGAKVRALREDRNGILWIGTLGEGLARLDPSDGRITAYRHDPAVPTSLSHDRVRALLEDKAGRLWVATDGGLDLLDGSGLQALPERSDRSRGASPTAT